LQKDGASAGSGAQCAAIQTAVDESEEITMFKLPPFQKSPTLSFESLNWVADEPLLRDQTQSKRLHEPEHLINTIDPMTGRDIEDVTNHPSLVDGKLTVYFETEASRKAYQEMPLNHPNLHLPYQATSDDDRGG
jgi:hypothetical protein